jgi:hypothetical protein
MFKFKQNKIKEGEIHFQPIQPNRFFSNAQPEPAVKHLPQWYKDISRNVTHNEEDFKAKPKFKIIPMGTVKKCIPVLDALSAGYIYTLPIELMYSEEERDFAHNSDIEFIQGHDGRQLENFQADPSFIPMAYKWRNLNIIKTAPGWSCLFTHPLNRLDLPFHTLSGVVDTDVHPMPVNFPFLMKRGFSGKLPIGTPLVQIIPFKRQEWQSVTDEYDAFDPAVHETTKLTEDIYKKTLWNKKRYN